MYGCRKEIDGVACITRRLLFDYYREKLRKPCPVRPPRFFLKMPKICAIPTKPLSCRAFQFAGLITPTLKAAGSNPVGRTTANLLISMGSRFLFYLRIRFIRPFSNIFLTSLMQAHCQLICNTLLSGYIQMPINISSCLNVAVSHPLLYIFQPAAVIQQQACTAVPLRYNNDKQKKPLFSRGLSVCRLLFNSFSKLKIDENYKEKRRLFY